MFLIRKDETVAPEAEALAAYVDAVVAGRATTEPDLATAPIVDALRAQLRPVEPSPDFVASLRLRLVAAADQRGPILDEAPPAWRQPRVIIGAAGLVSAAAVIAFVARSRIMQAKAAA